MLFFIAMYAIIGVLVFLTEQRLSPEASPVFKAFHGILWLPALVCALILAVIVCYYDEE